jgi:hypothetical protein
LQAALAGAPRADTRLAQVVWPPLRPGETLPGAPRAGEPPPAWQPIRPTPMPPAPPPPVAGPRVILKVDNFNGRLQQHTQFYWRDVCLAPCGYTLDPNALYRIGGGTSIPSRPFQLPRASGDVHVDADVGSKVTQFVGLGLMIGGLAAAGYGAFFWSMARDYESAPRTFGIVLISVGAVLEVVGLPLFLQRTSVEVR